jgi:hypothetical protein
MAMPTNGGRAIACFRETLTETNKLVVIDLLDGGVIDARALVFFSCCEKD